MKKHGYCNKVPEYYIWKHMKARCYNKNNEDYYNYGGRGIAVCDRWKDSFENFYKDMGSRPSKEYSIHRLDNDKNYCLENCVWANDEQQANEKRNNHYLTYNGKTQSVTRWSRELGLDHHMIYHRINNLGWSVEKALETPARKAILITYKGKSQTMREWGKELNIPWHAIRNRLQMGWDINKIFETPIIKKIPRNKNGQFTNDL